MLNPSSKEHPAFASFIVKKLKNKSRRCYKIVLLNLVLAFWPALKKAFTSHIELLQYIRLTFGPGNAPASFQRLLELVLQDYIGKFVFRYIEDILIFSATFEDHLSHVAQVLQTRREAYLRVQIDKSQFARNSVEFLGHLINPEGTGPNKRNIEAVTSFPTPAKIKDAHAFLGLCNYYGRFIENYSVLAGLLLQLLKKDALFEWHPPRLESFLALKERLTTAPILAYPDFSIPFTLYTHYKTFVVLFHVLRGYLFLGVDDGGHSRE